MNKNNMYKIINSSYGEPYKYHIGINSLPKNIEYNEKSYKGFYYTNIKNIFAYLKYGTIICELKPTDDAIVYYEPECMYINGPLIDGYRSNKIDILNMKVIDLNVIKELIALGADITCDDYNLFKWALLYNYEVWNYLSNEYSDIIENNKDWIFE